MDEEICDLKTNESKSGLRFPEFLVNFSIDNPAMGKQGKR